MTQEEKDYNLLLRDLSARLTYGVKVRYSSYKEFITCKLHSINPIYKIVDLWSKKACFNSVHISKIKPYLFPLSSITEEQKEEYCQLQQKIIYNSYEPVNVDVINYINWCYKNHIDINGLIPMGLALEAQEGMYD